MEDEQIVSLYWQRSEAAIKIALMMLTNLQF